MHIKNKTTPVVLLLVLLSVISLLFMSADAQYIAAPGLACFIMVIWLFLSLKNRDQQIPFIDVGMFCALATLVYTIYPLMNYWVNGFQFGFLSDNRLIQYNPSSAEMGIF